VGAKLAERLNVGFRDTDADIEAETDRLIGDIFVESGEPYFRELESAAVRRALVEHPGVLALGGGAVMDQDTRNALGKHRVAFLDVGLAAAMSRLEMNRSRPLLLGNVRAQWQHLADKRRPLYEEIADITVLTDGLSIDDIVTAIDQQLSLTSRKTP
jgi:shikimate kinase